MSVRTLLGLFVLSLALLLCLGCGARGERLLFTVDTRQAQVLRQARGGANEVWYGLRRPVTVGSAGLALYLRYRGDPGNAELAVYPSLPRSSRRPAPDTPAIARRKLPLAGTGAGVGAETEAVVYVPLPKGSVLGGFVVRVPADAAVPAAAVPAATLPAAAVPAAAVPAATLPAAAVPAAGEGMRILAAGLSPELHGLLRTPGVSGTPGMPSTPGGLHFGPEVAALLETPTAFELRLTPGALPAAVAPGGLAGPWQLLVEYTSVAAPSWAGFRRAESGVPAAGARPARVEGSLVLEAEGRRTTLLHRGLAGEQRLAVPGPLVGFEPQRLTLRAQRGGSLKLGRLEIRRIGAAEEPIPADPGAILMFPQERWRGEQHELFIWTRRPEILIMDTASYAVQSKFFKRLAFYIEKGGYRGRLLSDEEFAGLHGYNAHDYRAEDLARFFTEARRRRFPLNPEEELLKRILVANGVLLEGTAYEPGRGAILSISRSSSLLLRQHLLTHECYHGLFFVLPEYREASIREWQALEPVERSFWELFFTWVGYDTGDPYLAANEYQAYLFQQERPGVDSYFRDLTAPRLVARYPRAEAGIRALLARSPDSFAASFDRLEPLLVRYAGLEGGRVIELLPADQMR